MPNGWFAVARSDELRPGQVLPVHYFARDLVAFRSESGQPRVLDAYCAHMGAHLGIGPGSPGNREPGPGTVVGDCIQCPFHGWRYDGSGRCVEIPYSDARIPSRARVKGWAVREHNGLIFAWHHLLDEPPGWELPAVPEFNDEAWTGPIYTERDIATCNQEMAENDHDFVHFAYVHTSPEARRAEVTYRANGRIKTTTEYIEQGRDFADGVVTFKQESSFTRETHQLGFVVLRIPDLVSFVAATSPIDEEHVRQRWVFAYPKKLGDELGQGIVDAFAQMGVYQDIPIWEHKRYLERPLLVKGDGPIGDFRRWAKQFYSDPAAAPRNGELRGGAPRRRRAGASRS
jgi:phenylpropionate dioxygenase-like ring-hydroxylating dioxygenase large terminal subunit